MAENVDNSLMLEILKEMRTDLQEVRKDQLEMRREFQQVRTEQQEMRKEQRDQRALLLLTADFAQASPYTEEGFAAVKPEFAAIRGEFLNFEERMRAHRGDLELMLKAELLGSLTSVQTRIENYVERRLVDRTE